MARPSPKNPLIDLPDTPVYLVDGSSFIFRAFHGLPPLTRPDGTPVGAVLGFCNMLLKLVESHRFEKMIVIFDGKGPNSRHHLYPEYKKNRKEAPQELLPQFSIVRNACHALGIQVVEQEGTEADDIIATYAQHALSQGTHAVIVSSDKDFFQLLSSGFVHLYDPLKNRLIDSSFIMERFGVGPSQVLDVQSLMGDASDNIPGVLGVGIKTASSLIQQFHTLEALYHAAHDPSTSLSPRQRLLLITHQEKAFLSKKLITLDRHVASLPPLSDFSPPALVWSKPLEDFLQENGFDGLYRRLHKTLHPHPPPPCSLPETSSAPQGAPHLPLLAGPLLGNDSDAPLPAYTLIQTADTLESWIHEATRSQKIAIDLETTSLNPREAHIVGLALCVGEGRAAYIPFAHKTTAPQLDLQNTLAAITPLLSSPDVCKIGHHLKYDLLVLKKHKIDVAPFDDTLLISYLLSGNQHPHNLNFLIHHYFNHQALSFQDVTGKGKNQITFDHVDLQKACSYAGKDADFTFRLHSLLMPRLHKEGLFSLYEQWEKPLVKVLVAMEHEGVEVDPCHLQELSQGWEQKLDILEKEIHQLAGLSFNIASPQQLAHVLFEVKGLASSKKGKSGAKSTKATVLEGLALQGHDLAQKILQWRQLSKLKNTYTAPLIQQISPETKRLHTTYIMTGTSTGRLASAHPNLQNIPIRTEQGHQIRQAFVPRTGFLFVSLDYSQIELRILAHVGEIASLQQALCNGIDIHTQTASDIFHVPLQHVTHDLRRQAKTINFGIIYGMGAYGLSQKLNVSHQEATFYIKTYFQRYPGIKSYMEKSVQNALRQGFVTSLFGRRCYIPGLRSKVHALQSAAKRQAINAPIQGTAADIIKKAMADVSNALIKHDIPGFVLLQVHDELLLEIKEEAVPQALPLLVQTMEEVATLRVPFKVHCAVGNNWYQAHP